MNAGRPVLLYACFGVPAEVWSGALAAALPHCELRAWPDAGAPSEVDYVLAWGPPPEFFSQFPHLRVIFSLGAGVDRLLADSTLPASVPLVRMVDPGLAAAMTEFVLMAVLQHHRLIPEFQVQQRARIWRPLIAPPAKDRQVGVMGLGELGLACAERLSQQGFRLRGWSRSPKIASGMETFVGQDGFDEFLSATEILVCLLPLTAETRGVLNSRTFASLPRAAALINVSRGACLVEPDLIPALDDGQLSAATLDVFATEPLPAGHPFWSHPRIAVVAHSAAPTNPSTAALRIAENIARDLAGEPLWHVVDRASGY